MTRRATEPTTPLGKALRALRNDRDLSGPAAATAAGISQSMLSRYEIGSRVPTAHTVRTLCRIYKAPAEERRRLSRSPPRQPRAASTLLQCASVAGGICKSG